MSSNRRVSRQLRKQRERIIAAARAVCWQLDKRVQVINRYYIPVSYELIELAEAFRDYDAPSLQGKRVRS